jgi:hypothetical protein
MHYPQLSVLLEVVSAIATCAVISIVIGRLSGWATLSRKFHDAATFHSYQWHFESVQLRQTLGNYHGCVKCGADQTGLYLAVSWPFRISHPPLFVPWAEIHVISGVSGIFVKRRKLLLGQEETVPLCLSVDLADKIKAAAGEKWPMETIDI